MTGREVRQLRDEEIDIELRRLREKLFSLRTQSVSEKIEDNSQFGKVRRDIARLLTERRARQVRSQTARAGEQSVRNA